MKTSGHLTNNGGIRAHSAGDFFPFRIMAQGYPENLTWWVIHPNGDKFGIGWCCVANAMSFARRAHKQWSEDHE